MTARELLESLARLGRAELDAEVRVVYHGYERPSFNLPAAYVNGPVGIATSQGPGLGFNVVCEEPRGGEKS